MYVCEAPPKPTGTDEEDGNSVLCAAGAGPLLILLGRWADRVGVVLTGSSGLRGFGARRLEADRAAESGSGLGCGAGVLLG